MQEAINKLKGAYDELVRVALQDNSPREVHSAYTTIKNAAAFLRQRNTQAVLKYSVIRDAGRVLKQKTTTSAAAVDIRREVYFHTGFVNELVQDYLDLRITPRLDVIGERQIDSITGPTALPIVSEGGVKPVVEATIAQTGDPFTKLAFTSLVTAETIAANPAFLDYWLFYATRRLEYELHSRLVGVLFSNARLLTIASQGLPQPRFADLIEYMFNEYDANAAEGPDIGTNRAVAAVAPIGYWRTRRIQQDGTGGRRNDADLFEGRTLIFNRQPNTSFTVVFGTFDLAVYVYDDILVTLERVVDEASDRNLYRFTAELYFTGVSRRHAGQGLSVAVSDTQAAIAALT